MPPLPLGIKPNIHPLALNVENAAAGMTRLARWGSGTAYDVAWSPDGKYLAVATGLGVWLYDANTLDRPRLIDVNDMVRRIAFRPDGARLAAAGRETVSVWEVESGQKVAQLPGGLPGGITKVEYAANDLVAAIGAYARGLGIFVPGIRVWDAAGSKLLVAKDQLFGGSGNSMSLSQDGKWLLSPPPMLDESGGLVLMDARSGRVIKTVLDAPSVAGDDTLLFSPDGKMIYLGWDSSNLQVIDLQQDTQTAALDGRLTCVDLNRTGAVALCNAQTALILFDPSSGETLATLSNPSNIWQAAASGDGKRVAVLTRSGVEVWDVAGDALIQALTTGAPSVPDFNASRVLLLTVGIWTENGTTHYVASGVSDADKIQIWNLGTGTLLMEFRDEDFVVDSIAFSRDGRRLAALNAYKGVRVWDLERRSLSGTLPVSESANGPIAFSPDGSSLTLGGKFEFNLQDETSTLVPGGCYSQDVTPYTWFNQIYTCSFEPDKLIMTEWKSGAVTKLNYQFKNGVDDESDWPEQFSVSPSGGYVAASYPWKKSIQIWDLKTGRQTFELFGHETRSADGFYGMVRSLRFSPDGSLLVSVGYDRTTRLWDPATGKLLRLLNVCCEAEFTPDGRALITAGDGVIRVWGVPPWP
jgi:WD40 repeat protein